MELSVFIDDGKGYIDLGRDNVFDYDPDGDLILEYDGTWITINGKVVSYYMTNYDSIGDDHKILGTFIGPLQSQIENGDFITCKSSISDIIRIIIKKEAFHMDNVFSKLRRFNIVMGALHLVQAIMMLIVANGVVQNISEFAPEIKQFYIAYNPATQSLETTSRVLFELPFGIGVALFLFLSAIAHALISLPKKLNAIYNADLQKNINKFRWFEYALSSSVMIVLISTLFGIYDIASLILIFVVNATMNLFGLVMEQLNSNREEGKVKWGPFVWGSFSGLAPWVVIILYMTGTGNYDQVPWFVWAIVGTYFVAFNTFPINMILQYKKVGKWKDYLYGERVYIILSLVAKTILAWLVLFGAMQP